MLVLPDPDLPMAPAQSQFILPRLSTSAEYLKPITATIGFAFVVLSVAFHVDEDDRVFYCHCLLPVASRERKLTY